MARGTCRGYWQVFKAGPAQQPRATGRAGTALRPFLEQIEAWILGLAGIVSDTKAEPAGARNRVICNV